MAIGDQSSIVVDVDWDLVSFSGVVPTIIKFEIKWIQIKIT